MGLEDKEKERADPQAQAQAQPQPEQLPQEFQTQSQTQTASSSKTYELIGEKDKAYIVIYVTDTAYSIQFVYPRYRFLESRTGTEFADHVSVFTTTMFSAFWKSFSSKYGFNPQPALSFNDETAKERFIKTFNEGGYSNLLNETLLRFGTLAKK